MKKLNKILWIKFYLVKEAKEKSLKIIMKCNILIKFCALKGR